MREPRLQENPKHVVCKRQRKQHARHLQGQQLLEEIVSLVCKSGTGPLIPKLYPVQNERLHVHTSQCLHSNPS